MSDAVKVGGQSGALGAGRRGGGGGGGSSSSSSSFFPLLLLLLPSVPVTPQRLREEGWLGSSATDPSGFRENAVDCLGRRSQTFASQPVSL